jgi:hypothetical protein
VELIFGDLAAPFGFAQDRLELVPVPFVLQSGAVLAQADIRFLVASLLGMTKIVGEMTNL